jgi:hypothetical protein
MRAAAIVIVLMAATVAGAQELIIYEGDAQKAPIPIILAGWGSGTAVETTEVTGIGPRVLKLASHGFYSGVRLEFGKPYDWSGFVGKANAFIELWLRPTYVPQTQPTTTSASAYGGSVTPSVRGPAEDEEEPGVTRSGATRVGPGGVTLPGTQYGQAASAREPQFLAKKMRVMLQTDKGFAVAEPVSFTPGTRDERGWTYVAVPISMFKGQLSENVRRLMIFTDRPDVFYVSQIRLRLLKLGPISANVWSDPVVAKPGQIVNLTAQVDAGPTSYLVTWDFDDRDGVGVDAAGDSVIARYSKAGEYMVTYTVRDLIGVRPPVVGTIQVRVVQ